MEITKQDNKPSWTHHPALPLWFPVFPPPFFPPRNCIVSPIHRKMFERGESSPWTLQCGPGSSSLVSVIGWCSLEPRRQGENVHPSKTHWNIGTLPLGVELRVDTGLGHGQSYCVKATVRHLARDLQDRKPLDCQSWKTLNHHPACPLTGQRKRLRPRRGTVLLGASHQTRQDSDWEARGLAVSCWLSI